jgi:hypothetical protein
VSFGEPEPGSYVVEGVGDVDDYMAWRRETLAELQRFDTVAALDHLYALFAAEDVESLASAFYRGHLRSAWLWLEAQP